MANRKTGQHWDCAVVYKPREILLTHVQRNPGLSSIEIALALGMSVRQGQRHVVDLVISGDLVKCGTCPVSGKPRYCVRDAAEVNHETALTGI